MRLTSISTLTLQRDKLVRSLASGQPLIDGSLAEIGVKCGNPNCRCASGEKHRSYILVKKVRGKSKSTYIPVDMVEEVKAWVAENRRIKKVMKEIAELNEQIIRLHVKTSRAANRNRGNAAE